MDTQQMFQELDRLYAQGKLDEAEEKMMGWMKEGLDSGNKSLCLMMCNEMEGLYRNTGRVAQAVDMADMALSLIAGMGLDGSIHHGTTLLNAATARRMAGDVEKALSQYREAEAIFKNLGKTDGYEMASLYNNISQIYQEQEEHEKALESLDKALELIKNMENSEAEVATTHVNRALSLMALGRLDEADEELKESLTFYASPEGVQSGHFGSALAAAGELAWRRGNYDQAIGLLEKALMVTQSRFGESDACAVIRQNLEMIKKEKEEKGITGAAFHVPDHSTDRSGSFHIAFYLTIKNLGILRISCQNSHLTHSFDRLSWFQRQISDLRPIQRTKKSNIRRTASCKPEI